ncbi:hypothetical protein OAX78_00305 [Planctomycetota bacterium]|nr:hypothetical protein [Planctomycetota bacterium]
MTRTLPALLALALVAPACQAQDEAPPMLEIFDVQDLLLPSPIQRACPRVAELGPTPLEPLDATELVTLARATVDDWSEPRSVEVHQGMLIVNQTRAGLVEIRDLLSDLRQGTGIFVQLEIRRFARDDEALRDLGAELVDQVALLEPLSPEELERAVDLGEHVTATVAIERWSCCAWDRGTDLDGADHGLHVRATASKDRRYLTLTLPGEGAPTITIPDRAHAVVALSDSECVLVRARLITLND